MLFECVCAPSPSFQSVNSAFRKRGAQTTELLSRIDGSEHLGEMDRTHREQEKKWVRGKCQPSKQPPQIVTKTKEMLQSSRFVEDEAVAINRQKEKNLHNLAAETKTRGGRPRAEAEKREFSVSTVTQ